MRLIGPAFLAFLLVLASAYVRWQDSGVFRELDYASFDWRLELRPPEVPGDQVAILVIDDATLQRLGHWPPPAELAATLEALGEAGAAVIALDLLLLEWRRPPARRILPTPSSPPCTGARSPSSPWPSASPSRPRSPSPTAWPWRGTPFPSSAPHPMPSISWASPPERISLRAARRDSRLGHVNVFVEPEGELRFLHSRHPPSMAPGTRPCPCRPRSGF
ncbi:MAG: CHASE2 domain-containing protein [Geminicoccaceae bacterium]